MNETYVQIIERRHDISLEHTGSISRGRRALLWGGGAAAGYASLAALAAVYSIFDPEAARYYREMGDLQFLKELLGNGARLAATFATFGAISKDIERIAEEAYYRTMRPIARVQDYISSRI